MTQPSRVFAVGEQRLPLELLHALAWVHWGAAWANRDLQRLGADKAHAIAQAAERVAAGGHDDELGALAWQPDAATHSQHQVASLVARLASQTPKGLLQASLEVRALDDVALGQSAADSFATAAQVAVALQAKARLLPALGVLRASLAMHTLALADAAGSGRRSTGQQMRALAVQLAGCEADVRHALIAVQALALGRGAAGVHPGLHSEFGACVVQRLAARLELPLTQAGDTPGLLRGHTALLALHGSLRLLALALAGLAPQGRSAPGEELALVCAQVVGHDTAIGFVASHGATPVLSLAPLVVLNTLDSLRLLADAMHGFSHQGLAELPTTPADESTRSAAVQEEQVPVFINGLHATRPRLQPLDAWSDLQRRRADI